MSTPVVCLNYDMAVRWADFPDTCQRIHKLGGVPLYGKPRHLRPGGRVAIVQDQGKTSLVFVAAELRGPERVKLANGKVRYNGYVLLAKKGTIRRPRGGEKKRIKVRWRAIGQISYYDHHTGELKLVEIPTKPSSKPPLEDDGPGGPVGSQMKLLPYDGNIPGRQRNDPEAKLVRAYVAWTNQAERFRKVSCTGPNLRVDLFDGRYWRLIEAKIDNGRKIMRTALGQLYDYKRFFRRGPSLGILVSRRPSPQTVKYLQTYRITVIWKTPSGSFSDSAAGAWTKRIRR
jgi:hypothetical protein